ncbi:hypothetical protein, partial [Klebsiella quasipneumoniae]|uniref:hypothetical protein n=2 Tax=Klebsiella TaxID=570 RepID=UPI002AB84140
VNNHINAFARSDRKRSRRSEIRYLPPLYGGRVSNPLLFSYIIRLNPHKTAPVLSSASHQTQETPETSPVTTGERSRFNHISAHLTVTEKRRPTPANGRGNASL